MSRRKNRLSQVGTTSGQEGERAAGGAAAVGSARRSLHGLNCMTSHAVYSPTRLQVLKFHLQTQLPQVKNLKGLGREKENSRYTRERKKEERILR